MTAAQSRPPGGSARLYRSESPPATLGRQRAGGALLGCPMRADRTGPTPALALGGKRDIEAPFNPAGGTPMLDFAAARRMMVEGQVRTSDVTDVRIIAAMLELPRERFVPETSRDLAYLDLDVPITAAAGARHARRLLQPLVLAKLGQAAAVTAHDRVLDVGCGTGYSSALLARLASAIVALEQDPALAALAGDNLRAVGASNVTIATGPLIEGWQPAAPYDVI